MRGVTEKKISRIVSEAFSFALLSHQGELKIRGGRGGLQFETQKSSLSIARYEGKVEGLTQEGSVAIESG